MHIYNTLLLVCNYGFLFAKVTLNLTALEDNQFFWVLAGASMVEGFLWAAKRDPNNEYMETIITLRCCTLIDQRCPIDCIEHFIETGNEQNEVSNKRSFVEDFRQVPLIYIGLPWESHFCTTTPHSPSAKAHCFLTPVYVYS